MKSNLAFVHEAASAAVADPPKTRTEEFVVGALRLSREVEISPGPYRSYCEDERDLRKELSDRGVAPLAVLPMSWWERMCSEGGLVTIHGWQDEFVFHPQDIASDAIGLGFMSWIGSALAIGTVSSFFLDRPWISTTFIALAGVALCHACTWPYVVLAYARLAIRLRGGRDAVFRQMLVDKGSPVKVGFTLPPAPLNAASEIRGLAGDRVKVTAEPAAFLLHKSLDRVVRDHVTSWFFSKGEALLSTVADPIVTYRRGSAVAVIAQWGEFPLEQELVRRVVSQPLG